MSENTTKNDQDDGAVEQKSGSWLSRIDGETYLKVSELAGIVSVGIFVISAGLRAHQNLSLIVVLSLIFVELTFIREAIAGVSGE